VVQVRVNRGPRKRGVAEKGENTRRNGEVEKNLLDYLRYTFAGDRWEPLESGRGL